MIEATADTCFERVRARRSARRLGVASLCWLWRAFALVAKPRPSLVVVIGITWACGTAPVHGQRPNVVLIMADDLGYETVGCYGGESYRTPHLDRLAKQGVKFNRAYAMPLCTNTRIQLMTGKYNIRNWKAFGILDPQEKTFGHLMQAAGYRTCIAGKWQLTSYDPPDYPGGSDRRDTGVHPRDAGFDDYCLWHVGHTESKGSRYADPVIEQNGVMRTDTDGKYGPDLWTDFIGNFMEKHRDTPFFVYYSMALPHNPMVPTPDSPAWKDRSRRHADETPFAADMIEYTDKMVGKVVSKLDELKLTDNTLILFYSDNGTNWRVTSTFRGKRLRGGKGKGTELGIRVPSIASWPRKVKANVETEELIDSVDFLPTILHAAGASVPAGLDGASFLPLLLRQGPGPRKWVYIHQDPRPGWDKDRFGLTRLALNQRYKLYEDGVMYDLLQDPHEASPLLVSTDDQERRLGRAALQRVLDGMKPYPMFDPASVPRPDPSEPYLRHQFQDQGGYVIVEAEQLPFPRDESWRAENTIPKYRGTGYLRAIRDQTVPPKSGITQIYLSIDAADLWNVAIRCRSDHVGGKENQVWLKAGDGPWMIAHVKQGSQAGSWSWIDRVVPPNASTSEPARFKFRERGNKLWIAPCSQNLKIDRIVCYQDDRRQRALNLDTPSSEFHPWASP